MKTLPMRHKWEENATNRTVEYQWKRIKDMAEHFKIVAALYKLPEIIKNQ